MSKLTTSQVLKNWEKRKKYIDKLNKLKGKERCVVCDSRIPPSRLKQFKHSILGISTCSSKCSHKNTENNHKLWLLKNRDKFNEARRKKYSEKFS
jgi:RNA polymerase-binding transcription factor DksA